MMKKMFWLLISAMVIVLEAGCSRRTEKEGMPIAPKTQNLRFAVIGKSVHPYWSEVELGVKAAAAKFRCEAEFFVPQKEDAGQQKARIESFLASGVQGLAFAASDPSSLNTLVKRTVKKGIPCIALDTDAPDSGRLAYIGTDNKTAGKIAGETLVKLLGGKGKVAICTGSLTALNSRERIEGFKQALKAAPGIVIVDTYNDNEDATQAVTLAERALLTHPDLNAFYGVYAFNGPAAAKAVKSARKAGKVKIVCFDATPEHIQYLQGGVISALLAQRPYMMGYKSIELLFKIRTEGEDVALKKMQVGSDRKLDTGVDVVTKETLAAYKAKLQALDIPTTF
jgi:ribose transport system substrate-binding protein